MMKNIQPVADNRNIRNKKYYSILACISLLSAVQLTALVKEDGCEYVGQYCTKHYASGAQGQGACYCGPRGKLACYDDDEYRFNTCPS